MLIPYPNIKLPALASCLLILSFSHPTFSCTRILKAGPLLHTLVGRNMDWHDDMQTTLLVYPQGLAHDDTTISNPLRWNAKYASIAAISYNKPITTDGMNEKGLAAHLLALAGSDYGERDKSLPGLALFSWAQYYLDNFATVDEAVRFTQSNAFQLVPSYDKKTHRSAQLHLALEDATGDSAIIEYTQGQPTIYHNKDYTVLTNSPTFDKQLINIKQYKGLGGDKPLPGTTDPADRFVRATYYTAHLPQAKSTHEAIAGVFSVMQNTVEPFGTGSPTVWSVVADLSERVYYFNSLMRFNTIWVSLDKFKVIPGSPVRKLDLTANADWVGDVSEKFVSL